jgi:hypothetical protein
LRRSRGDDPVEDPERRFGGCSTHPFAYCSRGNDPVEDALLKMENQLMRGKKAREKKPSPFPSVVRERSTRYALVDL